MKNDKGFLGAILCAVVIGLTAYGGGTEGQSCEKPQNAGEQALQDGEENLDEKEMEDIYVCQYCDSNGTWKYLILVREEKDGTWKVIHHGRIH